jgi:hypothetical protein
MDTVKVITNNVPRPIIEWADLTDTERADFDYIDAAAIVAGESIAEFFRYKGTLYHLNDCETTHVPLPAGHFLLEWTGYYSDSFYSGVVFRYVDNDCMDVIVGRYIV